MKKRTTTLEPTYHGKTIMTDSNRNLACDTKILDEIEKQFDHATKNNSKVFFMRMDIRLPESYPNTDNSEISKFNSKFIKELKRDNLSPQYLTVREQSREKHQHYHMVLWLDGKQTKSAYNHLKTAERILRNTLHIESAQGLIDDCSKTRTGERQVNGVMLYPKDNDYQERLDDSFRRASYLAKVNTKSCTPQGEREMFSSRLKKSK